MSDVPSLLRPLKDRLAAATPGPWTDALGKTFKAVGSIADARLIVNAPTDQAKLIAAVEGVLAVADRWEEEFPHKAWQVRSAIARALGEREAAEND